MRLSERRTASEVDGQASVYLHGQFRPELAPFVYFLIVTDRHFEQEEFVRPLKP